MVRTRRWTVASVVMTAVAVSIGAVAFGGTRIPRADATSHVVHTHMHAHGRLSVPVGLESSISHPEPGSTFLGGRTISHLGGARGVEVHPHAGRGRVFYTGATALEPTLGIDKKGNIFFQAHGSGAAPKVVMSRDGGRSWDDVTPPLNTVTADPFLYVDKGTDRTFTADLSEFLCMTVSHTDDAAKSWTSSKACGLTDHQNLFTGPPVSSSTVGYPNIVYLCAMDIGATSAAAAATSCLKSLDGGITWVRTGTPAFTNDPRQGGGQHDVPGHCGGGTGHGFVDDKGVVYLPRGWCSQPYLAISKDEGATWERVQVADIGMARLEDGIPCPPCTTYYEHEAAGAVDDEGNIYYFWVAKDRLPYLVMSRDGGKSFSKPLMVGPPELKEAWGPTMDIGATGKLALAYIGSTNAPGGTAPDGRGPEYSQAVTWNGYITTSVDALSKRPRFFTTRVNPLSDPIMRGECGIDRCGVQFDFIDVVIDPEGNPWTSMVDGCWPPPGDGCGTSLGTGFVGTVVGGPKLR